MSTGRTGGVSMEEWVKTWPYAEESEIGCQSVDRMCVCSHPVTFDLLLLDMRKFLSSKIKTTLPLLLAFCFSPSSLPLSFFSCLCSFPSLVFFLCLPLLLPFPIFTLFSPLYLFYPLSFFSSPSPNPIHPPPAFSTSSPVLSSSPSPN